MIPGRDNNKQHTTTTGEGLSNSSTHGLPTTAPQREIVSGPGSTMYQGEEDSATLFSGPGGGDIVSASEPNPHVWGHVTPSGSRLEINDSAGSERIEIVHRSGASYTIDPDGAIYITSTSPRGAGLSAPLGDYFISAGGHVTIKGGASVSVDTQGDFTLKVGGTFFVEANDISVRTGNVEETIDGSRSTSITNDSSTIIGGISRNTVAGDSRLQVSGQYIEDVGGDRTDRAGGNRVVSVGGNSTTVSGGDTNITGLGDTTVYGGGDLNLTGSGTATVFSGGAVKLTGSEVNASPAVDLALWSDSADAAITAQSAGVLGAGGSPLPKPPVSAGSAGTAGEQSAVEVVDANDIVDTLTSRRQFPEYPGNAVHETSSVAGLSMISHDELPVARQVYDIYSGGNSGNWNPSYSSSPVTSLPDTPINRDPNIRPSGNHTAPPFGQMNVKISKYYTLAQIIRGGTTAHVPPSSRWDELVTWAVAIANDLMDPIKEQFPDVIITSWWRPTKSTNHMSGRAIDIVVNSRSTSRHAELARFARDNLPVDQVYLEKNDQGRTHVHLRIATGPGNPRVLSCGDPKCIDNTPGIDVAYLLQRGVPNT